MLLFVPRCGAVRVKGCEPSPQSAPLLSRPCPCFVALHVLSFLSRNKIFYQIQIYRAFLNTEDLFSSGISSARFSGILTPYKEPKAPLKRLPLRTLKASQVFSTESSLNFKAYLQTSAAAFE